MCESYRFNRFLDTRGAGRHLYTAAFVCLFPMVLGGCAVHYFDPDTGVEHVWGFGHLVMKVQPSRGEHQAIIRGTDVIGLELGKIEEGYGFGLGWSRRRRIEINDENNPVVLEWPTSSFLNVRVGSKVRGELTVPDSQRQIKEKPP